MTTISFIDVETGDNGFTIVRKFDNHIVIGVSLEKNGDIQIVIDEDTAKKIADAIISACAPE